MMMFNKERLKILDLHIIATIFTFIYAIRYRHSNILVKNSTKVCDRAPNPRWIYILIWRKHWIWGKLDWPMKGPSIKGHPPQELLRNKQRQDVLPTSFTRLNTSKTNILMENKDMKKLKWPSRTKSPLDARDKSKYCVFHQDHDRTMKNCKASQQEIEALIKREFLSSYVDHDKRPRNMIVTAESPGGQR